MRLRACRRPPSPTEALRRLLACTLALGAGTLALGCGDDGADTVDRSESRATRFITLTEAENVIERGALAVVRTGGADVDPDVAEEGGLIDAARYESQSGREFDVLVFASPAAAQRASASVIDVEDGESGIRAVNVLTVFPARSNEVDAGVQARLLLQLLRHRDRRELRQRLPVRRGPRQR